METKVERARALLRQARAYWRRDMWRADRLSGGFLRVMGTVLARSAYIVIDAFRQDKIRLRAATLTFVTLLSLVPLLAVAFSLFTAFGGLEKVGNRVQEMVVDTLAVQQREVVTEYLDRFIEGANAGGLGAFGSVLLLFTAVSTISNIETAFNDIWGVHQARSWVRRFQVYIPLVILGPVLFGMAFSAIVAAEGSPTVKAVIEAAPMLEALFGLGPVLLYSGLFIFLYLFIPNTSVRVPPALVGGVVAGVLYVLGQQLFTIYAARAISYSAIYGSFGAIPLTILWIYVSWTLVLLGATVCFAVQSARSYEPERKVPQREREQVAGRLVVTVAERFAAGEGPIPAQTLIDEALVPPRLGRRLLEELVEKGLLLEVVRSEEELGYAPARPLERVSLADIVDALRGKGAETPTERPAQRACVARLREADAREAAALGEISLRALLDGDASGPEALARNGDDAARPKAAPPALARRSDDGGST